MAGYKENAKGTTVGSNFRVIGFLTALLIFTANHTDKDRDLLDAIIDKLDAQSYQIKQELINK